MIKAVAKRLLGENSRHALRTEAAVLSKRGVRDFLHWNGLLTDAAIRERLMRRRYRLLDEAALSASRRSETVYIFGSGASLNDISPAQWAHMAAADTFGFTAFIYQKWIPVRYHLIRGGIEGSLVWRAYAEEFAATLGGNPHFADAILILQGEYLAMFANQLLGYKLIRPDTRIFRYRTARGGGLPTLSFADGIRHNAGTLCDCVNAAACIGWRKIVLAGVDLYDSRYFWLPPDRTYGVDDAGLMSAAETTLRGRRYDERHNTALNGIVQTLGQWRDYLDHERQISLSVLNPRSLLASVMPVHRLPC